MKDFRPGYHYRPRENWINDPCGLIQHRGVYHLFHQYNPYEDRWGHMHWGHATSNDMVHWKQQDIALKPDTENGETHCFTGCGRHLPDGRPVFYYTSISDRRTPEQWHAFAQDASLHTLVQTSKDAMDLSMHLPLQDISEWRDPSVLPYENGYLMALGCRLKNRGACLLYTSEDGLGFTYHSVLAMADGDEDYSWECPNLMRLGDKYVLMYSPYRQPKYIVGTLQKDLRFIPEAKGVVDCGGQEGYYAPQSFRDAQNRQLILGWMTERSRGDWDGIHGWAGCMSLPREAYLEGNVLKMRVIQEIEKLVASTERGMLPLLRCDAGEQYRLILEVQLEVGGCVRVELLATPEGEEKTVVTLYGNGRLLLDRGASSQYPTHHGLLERRLNLPHGRARLEIYVDHSTIEVGGNDEWISSRVYPSREDATGLSVRLQNGGGSYTLSQMNDCEK